MVLFRALVAGGSVITVFGGMAGGSNDALQAGLLMMVLGLVAVMLTEAMV